MTEFVAAPDLEALAVQVIAAMPIVEHVDPDDVLFLWENISQPKMLAACFKFGDHPINMFTEKPYAIVFYRAKCDYMTPNQLTLMMYHELMHIGKPGGNLIDHKVKDFKEMLRIDLDWCEEGADVPDILSEGYEADE